jgi:xanthine/CO dehydrogenase XdhC/CoxF family maturation factor
LKSLLNLIQKILSDGGVLLSGVSDLIIFRILPGYTKENTKGTAIGVFGFSKLDGISEGGVKWLTDFAASQKVCGLYQSGNSDGERIVAERVAGKRNLFVLGAGHVGQAVALMGALLGYNVHVVDDRPEFAARKRFPDLRVNLVVKSFDEAIDFLDIDEKSAVVIVTRGHQFDELCLRALLGEKAGYVGMIGSKRRVLSIFKKLELEGLKREDMEKVHAPIGLAIGAVSPQEIAVAILAEIISETRR